MSRHIMAVVLERILRALNEKRKDHLMMFYRVGSYFFFGLTVVLLGAAVVAYFWVPDEPGAAIDEPTREFPALAVGEHEVRFRLHNPTQHTIRIVGAGTC